MTEDSTGGFGRGRRDTAQVDLRARPVPDLTGGVTVADPESSGEHPSLPAPRVDGGMTQDSGSLSQVRTAERHLDEILAAVPQPDPIELAVLDAQGVLCAEDVVSARALPSFDQAALHGYAARSEDVAAASIDRPVQLAVVGENLAGAAEPSSIGPGLAVKVAAGAMLPTGADVVVPAVWTDQGAARVTVHAAPPPGSYLRRTEIGRASCRARV